MLRSGPTCMTAIENRLRFSRSASDSWRIMAWDPSAVRSSPNWRTAASLANTYSQMSFTLQRGVHRGFSRSLLRRQ